MYLNNTENKNSNIFQIIITMVKDFFGGGRKLLFDHLIFFLTNLFPCNNICTLLFLISWTKKNSNWNVYLMYLEKNFVTYIYLNQKINTFLLSCNFRTQYSIFFLSIILLLNKFDVCLLRFLFHTVFFIVVVAQVG